MTAPVIRTGCPQGYENETDPEARLLALYWEHRPVSDKALFSARVCTCCSTAFGGTANRLTTTYDYLTQPHYKNFQILRLFSANTKQSKRKTK